MRTNAAAAAGLLARIIAAIIRLSLLLRGRVPDGITAAAAEQARTTARRDTAHHYARVSRDGGFTALQYWFFYPMNDWRSSFGGVNDHEADWEQITVFVVEGDRVEPAWVAFASHDEKGADLRRRWDDPALERLDEHPVAYIGAGSHSAACAPGDYLVRVAPELPAWLAQLQARVARILPWWDPASVGIGIPFIDYRRGEGLSIGPGQDLEWTCDVIDDDTPWVTSYQGLWGRDTGDPLGGERAPAGPRYERDGSVRRCWRRPVTWAALDQELPDQHTAALLWSRRPGELHEARRQTLHRLEATREELRQLTLATRAGTEPDTHRRREELAAQLAAEEAEIARLDDSLERLEPPGPVPAPPADPRAHLRQRAVPLDLDRVERSRALRAWASVSAALLLAALGLLLLLGSASVLWPAVALVLGMLLVEAAVRRRLLVFVVNLAVTALVIAGGLAMVRLLLNNLRAGIGVLLLLGAGLIAAQGLANVVLRSHAGRPAAPPDGPPSHSSRSSHLAQPEHS